ncbi:MAG: rRNA maturation RNase YbeY [Rhodopseudomonas sp.]|nr:rRNA maturation RNase YbeY [Rhodopseudomonas sp.]
MAKPEGQPKAKPKGKPEGKPRTKSPAPAVTADIQIDSDLWDAQPEAEQTVRAAIAAAAAAVSTPGGEVSILLTDDSAIQALNRDWRGFDKPTNVLSFPAPKGPVMGGTPLLGDIAIAYETLLRECDAEGREFLHHLTHLTVHGFLHLIGYDHQNDAEADEMEGIESNIMIAMNLPDPWLTPWHHRDSDQQDGGH